MAKSTVGAFVVPALLVVCLARTATTQEYCSACHASNAMLRRLAPDSAAAERVRVDPSHYAHSVHGAAGITCTTCHRDIASVPHDAAQPVACGRCHADAARDLAASVHGRPFNGSGAVPATCADCHTSHDILHPTDPASSVYRMTQFEICATCHSDAERMATFGQENTEMVRTYLHSVHGRGLLAKGLTVAPVCTDCHGIGGEAHRIEQVADSVSPMNRDGVADACGRCHVGVRNQWARGVHGREFTTGNRDVPTCTDCHGEHAVSAITDTSSGVFPTHVARTCAACHDREDLNEKYDLPTARAASFRGSFHGVALASGELTVANCESCHGAHEIRPSSDSLSTINPNNLVATCGRCHPGIGSGVSMGRVHVTSVREDINTLAWIIQWFYALIVGGIVLYGAALIALDQYRHRVVDPRRKGHHDG
ncbi:MAG TPA: cytochrome c3 family protein [Gemmatimonadales bacterium]